MPIKILDVGQCGFDGPRMSALFKEKLNAVVDIAATGEDAKRRLASGQFNLVLVNRVLNADRTSGIDLIDALVKSGVTTPLMLVSDRPDAQDQAVARGKARYDRFLKSVGMAMVGDSQAAMAELLGRGHEN